MSKDASLSIPEPARKTRLSLEQTRYRLEQLMSQGVIASTNAIIDTQYFGYNRYSVVLKIANITTKKEATLKTSLKQNQNVSFAVKTLGEWDFRVQVLAKSEAKLQELIEELREILGHDIVDYTFAVITKELKRQSFPLKMSKNKIKISTKKW